MSDSKPTLRLHSVDYYTGFRLLGHFPTSLLTEMYDVVLDSSNPDIVFYSSFGWEHLYYKNSLMLFWTGENEYPDFNICHYALSHMKDSVGGKNYWWPNYMNSVSTPPAFPKDAAKRPFASFLASHSRWCGGKRREEFVRFLMEKYKRVDCPGKVLHNIDVPDLEPRNGAWHSSKRQYVGRYKFNIAFENSNTNGYITEKLSDCFVSNTVPIYWGSEGNVAPFPKEAMICANDYPDFDSLLARIKEVDENDDLYLSILHANPLHQEGFMKEVKERREGLREFLHKVAQEALNRTLPNGCQTKRPVGNIVNIVNFITKKEEARILESVSQKTSVDGIRLEADMKDVCQRVDKMQTQITTLADDVTKGIASTEEKLCKMVKEQMDNSKWELAVMQLPLYRRRFLRVRILSHLLPKYRGGVYVKEKKMLRNLISQIERYIKDNKNIQGISKA